MYKRQAKGCLSLTGYQGILGYRTQTDQDVEWTAEREANRQKEIEAVKPIIAELKRTMCIRDRHLAAHAAGDAELTAPPGDHDADKVPVPLADGFGHRGPLDVYKRQFFYLSSIE